MTVSKPVLDCQNCGGRCCQYFALQIDAPEDAEDFDNLRWYLAHQHTSIFVEGEAWYLQINTPCRHLNQDGGCAIYEKRPKICRDYGWDEAGDTECHAQGKACDHDIFFSSMRELEDYLLGTGKTWASQSVSEGITE